MTRPGYEANPKSPDPSRRAPILKAIGAAERNGEGSPDYRGSRFAYWVFQLRFSYQIRVHWPWDPGRALHARSIEYERTIAVDSDLTLP